MDDGNDGDNDDDDDLVFLGSSNSKPRHTVKITPIPLFAPPISKPPPPSKTINSTITNTNTNNISTNRIDKHCDDGDDSDEVVFVGEKKKRKSNTITPTVSPIKKPVISPNKRFVLIGDRSDGDDDADDGAGPRKRPKQANLLISKALDPRILFSANPEKTISKNRT